ncbi:MAG: class IV adenylate cyclase [Ignavibacteria bacterium]
MRKNLEIKIPVENLNLLKDKIKSYVITHPTHQHLYENQVDTYFIIPKNGRLKLRIINNTVGFLIYYDRNETRKQRTSRFLLSKTEDPEELELILKKFFTVKIIVKKWREIFITGGLRFHLDEVENLGKFLEIEIAYEKISSAKARLASLIKYLQLDSKKFINASYSDLLILNKNKYATKI